MRIIWALRCCVSAGKWGASSTRMSQGAAAMASRQAAPMTIIVSVKTVLASQAASRLRAWVR